MADGGRGIDEKGREVMNILYFSQFYNPEPIAAAFRATDNAKHWVEEEHKVTVFTAFPNYPTGRVFYGYKVSMLNVKTINKIKVIRSKLIVKPNTSMFNRLENALSFFAFGLYNIISKKRKIGKNFDIVLGTSGTIFTGILAWIYTVLYKGKFVFEIRDITYKQLMATGRKADSLPVKGMRWLELFLCNRAAKVVVVTNGFKKILCADGIPEDKILVVTNGVDCKFSNRTCTKWLTLSYFGTLGISQNIVGTFKYAKYLHNIIDDFNYLIIGEGAQKDDINQSIVDYKLNYITLLPGMSSEKLEPYYEDTEISIVTLNKSEDFKYTIPSKLFQIMGRGIAVLFIGPEGEASDIVRQYNAGIVLTGTEEEDFEALRKFFSEADWREQLKEMGSNGYKAVAEHYSRKVLAKKYLDIFEELLD